MYRKGHANERLREALNEPAEHKGLITLNSHGGSI